MSGTLYLVGTPIGNLEDMTFRAVRVLKEVDMIAAEDTRNSIKLLNHFEITTPMTSYHEFNKYDKAKTLVEMLLSGKNVAVITDAGMPGISDPGEELVKQAHEAGINVTGVPGATAFTDALVISGLPTRRLSFEAFLPHDKKERAFILDELKNDTRTICIYEAPHRLVKTLELLYGALGERRISVCRELTKKHETIFQSTFSEAIAYYKENAPKGECVIVVEGKGVDELIDEARSEWDRLTIPEHLDIYLQKGIDKKEAMKLVAKDRGISKRDVYQAVMIGD